MMMMMMIPSQANISGLKQLPPPQGPQPPPPLVEDRRASFLSGDGRKEARTQEDQIHRLPDPKVSCRDQKDDGGGLAEDEKPFTQTLSAAAVARYRWDGDGTIPLKKRRFILMTDNEAADQEAVADIFHQKNVDEEQRDNNQKVDSKDEAKKIRINLEKLETEAGEEDNKSDRRRSKGLKETQNDDESSEVDCEGACTLITTDGGARRRPWRRRRRPTRCSRANGSGWRCCRPALEGYSHCDYHFRARRLRQEEKKKKVGAIADEEGAAANYYNSYNKDNDGDDDYECDFGGGDGLMGPAANQKEKGEKIIGGEKLAKARSLRVLLGQSVACSAEESDGSSSSSSGVVC